MFLLLAGKSRGEIIAARKQAVADFLHVHPDAEVLVFDCEEPGNVIQRYQEESQAGLFAIPKVLTIKETSTLSKEAQEGLKLFWEEGTASEDVLHIVIESSYKKSDAWCKYLTKTAREVRLFEKATSASSEEQARALLSSLGREEDMSAAVLRALVTRTGGAPRMESALQKVLTYQPAGPIDIACVEELIETSPEVNVFHALDALFSDQKAPALKQMYDLIQNGESDTFSLLGMCAWQVRRMLLVMGQKESGVTQVADIARVTKLPPFVVQKVLRQERAFPKPRLVQALALLSRIDQEIKQGRMHQDVALEQFVSFV